LEKEPAPDIMQEWRSSSNGFESEVLKYDGHKVQVQVRQNEWDEENNKLMGINVRDPFHD
jgi:hypothetical protein